MGTTVQSRITAAVSALALSAGLLSVSAATAAPAAAVTSIAVTGPREVTMSAGDLRMVFNYAAGAEITSLSVGGVEKLAGRNASAASMLQLNSDGSVLSSASADAPARVQVSPDKVTADFKMSNADLSVRETWTFKVDDSTISHRIDRTYRWKRPTKTDTSIRHMGQPQMVWTNEAWDYIRKPEDGGTLPVGGTKLREAADARLPSSEPATYAPILGEGNTVGQTFTSDEAFSKAGGKFPTYGTTDSDMTLSLYEGTPESNLILLGTKRFEDVPDNSWLYLEFEKQLPPGEYYLEQSEPEGTIAWWTNSTSYDSGGQAYANREPRATEDRNIRVGEVTGPRAFPDGLALESGGNRYGAEQSNFTYLDRTNEIALEVSSSSDRVLGSDHFRRGDVGSPDALETNWMASREPLKYTNGNPKGYVSPSAKHDEAGGHFSTRSSALVFSPIQVGDQETHSVTLTWQAKSWADYYDIGDLRGVDETLLSGLINDFGRSIMQDKRIGGSSERSFRSAQAPPFTSIWNVYAAELLQDKNAFAAFRAQMKDIRDGLQGLDGFVHCCYPYEPPRTVQPTYDVTDNVVNWPLAVATLYNLDPQKPWLDDMKGSVRGALDYAVANLLVNEGPTAGLISNYQCGQPAPLTGCETDWSEWNDQYDIGQVSAYHNVMAYAALTHWAELEREVLGDEARAQRYESLAHGIREKFNLTGDEGGFWSPETETFSYTRNREGELVKDCSHLFANGYALQYGLVEDANRRQQVARSLHRQYERNGWALHGSNPVSCRTTEPQMFFPFFEDGGVHFLMEQPAAQIGLVLGDRAHNVDFARTVVDRYGLDNFWGFSNVQPDTMKVRRDVYQEPWMGNNVLGAWPLYHDIFGFQPHHDRLDIVPYIDTSLVGSTIDYDWRGRTPITVDFNGLESYTVTRVGSESVRVGWRDREAGKVYTVVDGGDSTQVKADGDGIVWYPLKRSGTSELSIEGGIG